VVSSSDVILASEVEEPSVDVVVVVVVVVVDFRSPGALTLKRIFFSVVDPSPEVSAMVELVSTFDSVLTFDDVAISDDLV